MSPILIERLWTGLLDTLREMGADIAVDSQRSEAGEPVGDLTVASGALRAVDVRVSPAEAIDAAQAVRAVGYADRALFKDALCVTLAKSEEDFAGVLSALLRIPSDALRAVGERARESVKSKHSWDSHAAALSKILEEVATRPCQCALRADCRTGRVKALP